MWYVIILLVGFFLLMWGADRFVDGAASLAKKLGVPSLIIGLTVVAFGTSAPELTVSSVAGFNGSNEIAISNVLGSNMFNLLLVAGGSAIICPLLSDKDIIKRDWPATIIATLALLVMISFDGMLSRIDGMILLVGFIVIITIQVRAGLKERALSKTQDDTSEDEKDGKKKPWWIALNIVLGLTCIVVGGNFCVDGATEIARIVGLSETVIGLTIVAIGTSLPELVTSIAAARRGENGMAIGNVIGSNLFNILLILGVSSTLTPIAVEMTAVMDVIVLLAVSIILIIPTIKGKFGRMTGICCILGYVGYTAWILVR